MKKLICIAFLLFISQITLAGSWGQPSAIQSIEAIDNWDGMVIWGAGDFMSINACGGPTTAVYLQSSHKNYYILYGLIMNAWKSNMTITPTLTGGCGKRNTIIIDGVRVP